MTVAEMIEWLKTQPQDAVVRVPKSEYGETYHVDFDPWEHAHLYGGSLELGTT